MYAPASQPPLIAPKPGTADWLFTPFDPPPDPQELQRRRLTSIGILGFAFLCTLLVLLKIMVGVPSELIVFPAIGVGFAYLGYILSRTRYPLAGALCVVLPPLLLAPFQLSLGTHEVDLITLISLPLATLYAIVLLPTRLMLLVSLLTICVVIGTHTLVDTSNHWLTGLLVVYSSVIAGAGLVIKQFQYRDQVHIVQQSAVISEQEHLLRSILNATPDHYVVYDPDGRYLFMNEAALATMNLKLDEVVGRTWRELAYPIAPETGANIDSTRQKVLESGQPHSAVTRFTAVDGDGFYEYILTPVRNTAGRITMIVGATRNLTHQHRADSQRQEMLRLKQQVEALQHVISDTSHDMRTPLTSVNTTLHLMKATIGDPERREYYTQVLQAQMKNVLSIVEDMESMSRLESGKEEFDFQLLDMNDMVARMMIEYEPTASAKHQVMSFVPDMNLPLIQADLTKLRRALTNLVTNAMKYTPEKGRIEARSRYDAAADQIIFEVKDSGIGIPATELSRVFERAYRTQQTSGIVGKGLGLAITRKIIEAHGGKVDVESSLGSGSTFRVMLPARTSP
jgi:PAS domain S-box-containing protein